MRTEFSEYANYYQAFYLDKNYVEEASYVQNLMFRAGQRGAGKLIEFGAGQGKLSIELKSLGYSVVATDISPEMASLSSSELPVTEADIRTFKSQEKFDSALAFFHVISYLQTDEDVANAFHRVSELLAPNGVFVADFWFKRAVESQMPGVRVKRAYLEDTELVRVAEPTWKRSKRLVEVRYTFFVRRRQGSHWTSFNELHVMRYFSSSELRSFARAAGLRLVFLEETLTGRRAGKKSWGVTALFKKH